MYRQYSSVFNSVANPSNILSAVISVDGDLHLVTNRLKEAEGDYHNARVRLRTYAGGGSNLLLRNILAGLVSQSEDYNPRQLNLLDRIYESNVPNDAQDFQFRCDDNPGSHLKISLSDQLFGLQTNCHDEEADIRSGGFLSRQGEGAMVWLHKDMFPKVHSELSAYLIDKKQPDQKLYSDRGFRFLSLEAA